MDKRRTAEGTRSAQSRCGGLAGRAAGRETGRPRRLTRATMTVKSPPPSLCCAADTGTPTLHGQGHRSMISTVPRRDALARHLRSGRAGHLRRSSGGFFTSRPADRASCASADSRLFDASTCGVRGPEARHCSCSSPPTVLHSRRQNGRVEDAMCTTPNAGVALSARLPRRFVSAPPSPLLIGVERRLPLG